MSMQGEPASSAARYPGLLEKLMTAVRPEFRADVLVFDPADPVFGGTVCRIGECGRVRLAGELCAVHYRQWLRDGKPAPGEFAGSRRGTRPLSTCRVPGCGYGIDRRGLCPRHIRAWRRAGMPGIRAWTAAAEPDAGSADAASCQVSFCGLLAHSGLGLCYRHNRAWKKQGCPDLAGWLAGIEHVPAWEGERADLAALGRQLRLEMAYVIQCRHDEQPMKTSPQNIRAVIRWLERSGVSSVLDRGEQQWRQDAGRPASPTAAALLIWAHRKITALAEGEGWDSEYPRDTWQMNRLVAGCRLARLQFGKIPQPWLKDLVKRWTRWRLSTGLTPDACDRGIKAVTRLAIFLDTAGITAPGQITRGDLERFLAVLHADLAGRPVHGDYISQLSVFFREIRRHHWDTTLQPGVMIFPEDYPRPGSQLPRHLAEHIMAQVEDTASLDRWDNPAFRLITCILIRCGLRVSDAAGVPAGCLARDSNGAPYLRYWNRKMKREALVPIDEDLLRQIQDQQQRNLSQWPDGTPVLFPRQHANISGQRPVSSSTYRGALYRWLEDCDIRDEHGQPVRLTPHQWRHTLGTRLINRDVPQHVVQKILDHDSAAMTAHYARLSDTTVREHWEKARKVSATGQPVQISPDGPLSDAAWATHQLSRTTQALPNGYCQLPLVRTCPHANSCLTCPMFVTTAEFLPQHHAQRQATLQIITAAEAAGHTRVAEMNKHVAGNLDKIITVLEAGEDGQQEAAADAS